MCRKTCGTFYTVRQFNNVMYFTSSFIGNFKGIKIIIVYLDCIDVPYEQRYFYKRNKNAPKPF